MLRNIIRVLLVLTLSSTALGSVQAKQANTLKATDVEKFIKTIEYIRANEVEFSKTEALRPDASMDVLSRMVNDKGEVVMFRAMLPDLAKNPDEENKLRGVVKKNGFSNLNHWAKTGDKVFVAYMGTQVSEKDRAEMRQSLDAMTPEMMAMMPPNVKQKMQQATALSNAMSNVPPEDVEAIRPFVARLEAAMGE